MLSELILLTALASQMPVQVPAQAGALPPESAAAAVCPTCHQLIPESTATCLAECKGQCPFPGACGHAGCPCRPKGYVPPSQDQWRVFELNPEWEIFGHEGKDAAGVNRFLYTDRRKRAIRPAAAAKPFQCLYCRRVFVPATEPPVCLYCRRVNP